jgi:hypothetical protein
VGATCVQVTALASALGAAGRAARGGHARALWECGCWAWASACPRAIVRDVQRGGQRGWAGVHARAVVAGSTRARAKARGCAWERVDWAGAAAGPQEACGVLGRGGGQGKSRAGPRGRKGRARPGGELG